jgi:hypothetical protein
MHRWGDEGVDWKGISDAANYIGKFLRRWGRVSVTQTKEKYGTARVYCAFGWYQIHSITHPGYVYSRYPRWLWRLDCYYGNYLTRPLNYLAVPFQKWLYRIAYQRALRKWPHLAGEILMGADFIELLMGLDPRLIREKDADGLTAITWDKEHTD